MSYKNEIYKKIEIKRGLKLTTKYNNHNNITKTITNQTFAYKNIKQIIKREIKMRKK